MKRYLKDNFGIMCYGWWGK